jgi:formate hydrogenlyase subunit 3/multisubunit Na+/H+ antiporter MnhD subunit
MLKTVDKLLVIAGISRDMYGKWRTHKLMSMLVTAVMLAVTAAVLVSILAIGGFYASYLLLTGHGYTDLEAVLIISLAALALTGVIVVYIRERLQGVQRRVTTPVNDVIDAFFDGLLSR